MGNWTSSATWRTEPSGGDERDDPGLGLLAGAEVEADAVDVDVVAAVDDDLVPAVVVDAAQIGVADHRTVGLPAHQLGTGDQQAAVGQPVDRPAETGRARRDHLAVAVEIDRHDLARAPVGEPQPIVVPARRLDIGEPLE